MNYRRLGNTDLSISEIGFGCMSLGTEDSINIKLIHQAIEGGINFFDTADLYQKGYNETTLGRALREKRNQVIVATKVGNQWKEDGSSWDWNPRKEYILSAVEKSLERLQTDYIDLYQMHGGTTDDPIDEVIEAFEQLQAQGKIRHYGISSIRPNVIREYIKRSNIVSVMMQYSLLDRRPEESCLDLLYKNNISVLARSTLAKGLLIDKRAEKYLSHSAIQVQEAALSITMEAGNEFSKTTAAAGYVLNHPAIASAVIGIRTIEQLDDVVKASVNLPLPEKTIEGLAKSAAVNFYTEHR